MSGNREILTDFTSAAHKAGRDFADVGNPPDGPSPNDLFAEAAKIGLPKEEMFTRVRVQDPREWGYEAEKRAAKEKDIRENKKSGEKGSYLAQVPATIEEWDEVRKRKTDIYGPSYNSNNNDKVKNIVSALKSSVDNDMGSAANGFGLASMVQIMMGQTMLGNTMQTNLLNSGLNNGYNNPGANLSNPMMGMFGINAFQTQNPIYTPQSFDRPNATAQQKMQAYKAYQQIHPFQNDFSLGKFMKDVFKGAAIGAALPWLALAIL